MAYHTIVKGDADAAMAGAEVVVKGRYVSDASQGVPIEPRAVIAQWQGDQVTIWSSTQVPYAARAGVAATLQVPEAERAHRRAAARRRASAPSATCTSRARSPRSRARPKRPVKLVFCREEEFRVIAQRREGIAMEFETGVTRDGQLVARKAHARARQGRVLRRGRVPRADGGDARLRPVRDRQRRRRGAPQLHEQPAVGLGPGAHRATGVLGARAAHGRGRRGDRDGPGRAPPPHADRRGRRGAHAPGLRPRRHEGHAREGRRDDRLRPRSARRRGDRRRGRLVAVHGRRRRAPTCSSTATAAARSSPAPRRTAAAP